MTYTHVLETLNQQYSIVGCVDLAEHDTNSLLSALVPYKGKVFKDNERLVIIADNSLPTRFSGYPPDIMPKMQEYIQYLNIAHFFVLIVTNIDNISQHLLQLQKTYYRQEDIPLPFIYVQN
jgi:hypothetical protein